MSKKKKHSTTYSPGNQEKKGLKKKKSRHRSREVKIIIIINALKGANAQESRPKKKKKTI